MKHQFRVNQANFSAASALALFITTSVIGCREDRLPTNEASAYTSNVGALLQTKCANAGCHAGDTPAAGWRADSYVGAIGCTSDRTQVTVGGSGAPILTVLARPDHASILTASERELLAQWVVRGTPSTEGAVHSGTFADPRAPDSHVQFLRSRRYRPLLDANDADACNKCHAGAPLALPGLPAAGATACTTCHAESGGPFACSTCHGAPGRASPPRDPCFAPLGAMTPAPDAHAAHVNPSALHAGTFTCSTCHPVPSANDVVSGAHIDGHVEVFFDYTKAGNQAAFDATTKTCTGTCHSRGGRRPSPAWTEGRVGCNDCHSSPPANHYAGACTSCHREANADGTALTAAVLHMNGKVDRGDGSGTCGACHGQGTDPWPTTNAHQGHKAPSSSAAVACETCHVVPGPNDRHPLGGAASVKLGGLALKGGARGAFEPATRSCSQTYCHTGRGGAMTTPTWTEGPAAATCGNCHAIPPPAPHTQSTSCAGSTSCHSGSVDTQNRFTPAGKNAHVDGQVTRGL